MTRILEDIVSDFRKTRKAIEEEEQKRAALIASKEYQKLEEEKQKIEAIQNMLLATVPDSREEYQADLDELKKAMEERKLFRLEEFKAKTRVSRHVDTRRVLECLGGDLDHLMLLTDIKMKSLEEFIDSNPELRKDLRSCIVEDGYRIVDIMIE
jgi:hypothetical protein